MNERLLQFLSAENISQSQFAEMIGVAKASVSHVLAGRNKPGYDFIEGIVRCFPNLNLEWLFSGKGKMYKNSDEKPSVRDSELQLFPAATDLPAEDTLDKLPQEDVSQTIRQNIPSSGRRISKIVVFYTDNTYQEIS